MSPPQRQDHTVVGDGSTRDIDQRLGMRTGDLSLLLGEAPFLTLGEEDQVSLVLRYADELLPI